MSGCIEWTGARHPQTGYGRKYFQGKPRQAHRLTYVEHHGLSFEDIEGLVVMHICDNPPCVNVDHLRLGTQADNLADMDAKGRRKGQFSPVLTEYAVRWIRSYHATGDYTQQGLADQFGVSRRTVGYIIDRTNWKHI